MTTLSSQLELENLSIEGDELVGYRDGYERVDGALIPSALGGDFQLRGWEGTHCFIPTRHPGSFIWNPGVNQLVFIRKPRGRLVFFRLS